MNVSKWPNLPEVADWYDTLETVHLWSQIVGKVRLSYMPWINHSWHVTLYVSPRGLTTGHIPHPLGGFEIEFNFIDHLLTIHRTGYASNSLTLKPMTVSEFYKNMMEMLRKVNLEVHIYPKPVELPDPIIPFPEDQTHKSYNESSIQKFWIALSHAHRVFTKFRSGFTGKVSPVHFYWGAFDLAVTRFSGRPAPLHPGGVPNCPLWVMQEAYSHEVCSAGFWPGTGLGEAAFYAYAYPEPEGFRNEPVEPQEAYYHDELGEFILPYEAVRSAANPDEMLLRFLESTYQAAANCGKWDRDVLESKLEEIRNGK